VTAALERALARLLEEAPRGASLGLERMHDALAGLRHPERSFAVVHVAGTNGKGSVSAMLASILRCHGLRVGLYTSPHLCRFNERIQIDGEPLGDEALADALDRSTAAGLERPTVFEALTLAAFVSFERAEVDVAVLEVGLGGRLDATNVIESPLACAVTSIGLDHVRLLGPDQASIAREKAAIAKRGAPMIVGPLTADAANSAAEVFAARGASPVVWVCDRDDTPRPPAASTARLTIDDRGATVKLLDARELTLAPALPGRHQLVNAAVAATTAWQLRVSYPRLERAIERGVREARWPGRLETLDVGGVRVLLDCAHNAEGAAALAEYLDREGAQPMTLVFGALDDKAWRPMLDRLGPLASRRHYAPPLEAVAGRRAVDGSALQAAWPGEAHKDLDTALDAALSNATRGDLVLVTGSIFLVGAARALLLGLTRHPPVPL